MNPFDTIVAPITGGQAAAVALIRLSGPDSWVIASKVFVNWPPAPRSHRAVYGLYVTGDDGLALPFGEDTSYTGERSVELSCHGSPASVRALVEACLAAGARMAEPGEFTQRAFLNGRMDLTQAEAVADTVNALTSTQLKLANRMREGALHAKITDLRNRILRLLAALEASVDFEEEIGPLDRGDAIQSLDALAAEIDAILATAEIGRIMRSGLRVAIVGPPNAGKSSLFNALVGRERAIVTSTPGTTRDYIEEFLDISGVPVVFIDTAGLRKSDDPVETLGMQRSLSQAAGADLVWYVYDASEPYTEPAADLSAIPVWLIGNKSDLQATTRPGHYSVSALTGQGLDVLVSAVAEIGHSADALQVPPINSRHKPLLTLAKQDVVDALATLASERPDDLLATHLRAAIGHLGEITGETASGDILERIFADFCVGK